MSSKLDDKIKGHWQWRRAVHHDENLRGWAASVKCDPRLLALTLADYGINGRHCSISAGRLSELLGWSLNTVKNHRAELIKRGWFTRTGVFARHLELLDIGLPANRPTEHGQPASDSGSIDQQAEVNRPMVADQSTNGGDSIDQRPEPIDQSLGWSHSDKTYSDTTYSDKEDSERPVSDTTNSETAAPEGGLLEEDQESSRSDETEDWDFDDIWDVEAEPVPQQVTKVRTKPWRPSWARDD